MVTLNLRQVDNLKAAVTANSPLARILPQHIGGQTAGDGLWRFFSPGHPVCGISRWNQEWCQAWGLPSHEMLSFGEDVFGNQLLVMAGRLTVFLCDHENGSCYDLELGVIDLLQAVVEHGVSWIDFYGTDAVSIGLSLLPRISWEQHIHWVQPLILGGAVSVSNTSVVDRHDHLHGHAVLWKQVSALPPGTDICFR